MCADTGGRVRHKVDDSEVQPPPRTVKEYPRLGVDPEPVVQVQFDGRPFIEDFAPLDIPGRGVVTLGLRGQVPVTQPGCGVVGSTTRIVRTVRAR